MLKRTKQIITAILATATIASSAIPVFASTYSDVSDSHWANSYINKITGLGAFSGYEDGTFRPDNVITYQEFTKTVACRRLFLYEGGISIPRCSEESRCRE